MNEAQHIQQNILLQFGGTLSITFLFQFSVKVSKFGMEISLVRCWYPDVGPLCICHMTCTWKPENESINTVARFQIMVITQDFFGSRF